MRLVAGEAEFAAALDAARSEAAACLWRRAAAARTRDRRGARHIEVQVFADQHGNVDPSRRARLLGAAAAPEADRGSPSPAVDAALREKLGAAAVALAKAVNYVGAGTVEFLLDAGQAVLFHGDEHAAAGRASGDRSDHAASIWSNGSCASRGGERFTRQQSDIRFHGHAIEARLCAEDPAREFPAAGRARSRCGGPAEACAPTTRWSRGTRFRRTTTR